MATATNDRLGEARRRIARLEVETRRGPADATPRMQQYIDTLRRDELELAEHRVAGEFAATEEEFAGAIDAELHRWDAHLDRMQVKAAAKSGAAREQAEAVIADLRQRRLSIGKSLSEVGSAAGEDWHDAKTRVLAELDELKSQADAAWRNRERNET